MTGPSLPLIIAGGGLAGGLVAMALARRRPDLPILLVEQETSFGGNHVWSFFDSDVDPDHLWLVEPLAPSRWPEHRIAFPARRRKLGIGYNSIRSTGLDAALRETLPPDCYRLGRGVVELGPSHVLLEGGERLEAAAVIDARGAEPMAGLDLAWQKFVGRTYSFERPHGCAMPMVMDATIEQNDGYRFLYTLPFSATELLIEDTYYSASPMLDGEGLGWGIDRFAEARGAGAPKLQAEETGVLPVVLGGAIEALWPVQGPDVVRLGLRGGFFHPTTGYSLPDAVRNAALLAGQADLSAGALYRLFHGRAEALWQERRFFRLLNRMLFHAAEPGLRYRVLEHFYRLPEPVIARFYAARLTAMDKLRILSGRPPVPIGRALAAMRETAA